VIIFTDLRILKNLGFIAVRDAGKNQNS